MTAGVRHALEYRLVAIVRAIVRALPESLATGTGSLLGRLFFLFDRRHRRIAERQLHAAFPRKSAAECRAIARATFGHFGRLLISVLRFSGLSREQMLARVEYEGVDRVRAALSAGKGALIFTGHFGYWELQGLAHALALPPISVLARPLDNPRLHELLEQIRCCTGNKVIYKQGALRRVLRALEQNEGVAILADQHVQGEDAVMVDFFDRPAATAPVLATLALRTGAPLIPAFALPLPGGRYRMVYEHPVEMPKATSEDPVREITQKCTDVLEMYVRRHPDLWLWMHRRWRTEPEKEQGAA
ncbi:MAG TPA: lysophospholipid acyltransferase family protein [Vicinamibacterales bacterium]|nr:lysophospholipid acyltransferase family protein [Vicinamibacterales bacterium]